MGESEGEGTSERQVWQGEDIEAEGEPDANEGEEVQERAPAPKGGGRRR